MPSRRTFLAAGAGALTAALALAWLPARGGDGQNMVKRRLTPEELAGEADTLIVDIRTPPEWEETGVLEGALLVTWTDAEGFLAAVGPHLRPGRTLALICRSDNRTGRASRELARRTDLRIVDVAGGMLALLAEGHRMVPPTASR